jgi:hypothetical protein
MCDEAELCDLTVDLLCLSQELIHAKLRLENSAKVRMFWKLCCAVLCCAEVNFLPVLRIRNDYTGSDFFIRIQG